MFTNSKICHDLQLSKQEVYLDVVKDRSHQQALMKLRISAHKLEIENGRLAKSQ